MKIIPVIHHINEQITMKNIELCIKHNVYGVFLISMEGINDGLSALAKRIKNNNPQLKIGVNHLGYDARESIYEGLNYSLDFVWSDNPIVTGQFISNEAEFIADEIKSSNLQFFNSVAFKYQKVEKNLEQVVINSKSLGFIPTTSGEATGKAADLNKLMTMKNAIPDYPLAIASGLTPDNVNDYIPFIEYGLVATGISKTFHELDDNKMKQIMENIK